MFNYCLYKIQRKWHKHKHNICKHFFYGYFRSSCCRCCFCCCCCYARSFRLWISRRLSSLVLNFGLTVAYKIWRNLYQGTHTHNHTQRMYDKRQQQVSKRERESVRRRESWRMLKEWPRMQQHEIYWRVEKGELGLKSERHFNTLNTPDKTIPWPRLNSRIHWKFKAEHRKTRAKQRSLCTKWSNNNNSDKNLVQHSSYVGGLTGRYPYFNRAKQKLSLPRTPCPSLLFIVLFTL